MPDDLRKMGFIYEATEPTSDSMAMLPMNRTLYVGELTDQAPAVPELTYELETVEAVFEHFDPNVNLEFQDEEGKSIQENLRFKNVGDFGEKALVQNSGFLSEMNEKQREYQSFAKILQNNKVLQKILADPTKKAAYLAMLQSLIQELEDVDGTE